MMVISHGVFGIVAPNTAPAPAPLSLMAVLASNEKSGMSLPALSVLGWLGVFAVAATG